MVFINTTHPPETFFLTVEGSDKSGGPRMGCFDSSMAWEDKVDFKVDTKRKRAFKGHYMFQVLSREVKV